MAQPAPQESTTAVDCSDVRAETAAGAEAPTPCPSDGTAVVDAGVSGLAAAAPAPPVAPEGGQDTVITVRNRKGQEERMNLMRIRERIAASATGLNIDIDSLALVVVERILGAHGGQIAGVETAEFDEVTVRAAADRTIMHPDWSTLAGRIMASNHAKSAPPTFSEAMEQLYAWTAPHVPQSRQKRILSEEFMQCVRRHAQVWNAAINPDRDLLYDHFAFHTYLRGYLLKAGGVVVETPQYMFMRVAVALRGDDVDAALRLYTMLSTKLATMATPTLFNAGRTVQQMSSCILMTTADDSLESIMHMNTSVAKASKHAAGIGVSVSCIRGCGAHISSTSGASSGLPGMLRITNAVTRAVDQGGKRPGRAAVYIEPWHTDVMEVLDLRRPDGQTEERARDLFYALWVPDEFMRRVAADEEWTLMCPSEIPERSPRLDELHGNTFTATYRRYEAYFDGKIRAADAAEEAARANGLAMPRRPTLARRVRARDLWHRVLELNQLTGMPYVLFKDAANRTSNQQNLGTIKSSNLCAEIVQFTSASEVAVCNLASISLPAFVRPADEATGQGPRLDLEALEDTAYHMAQALDCVIDKNTYSLEEAERSNMRHRPVGLGVQGLADVFAMLDLPYGFMAGDDAAPPAGGAAAASGAGADAAGTSDATDAYAAHPSVVLNKEIFAAVYHGAIRASVDLAKQVGRAQYARQLHEAVGGELKTAQLSADRLFDERSATLEEETRVARDALSELETALHSLPKASGAEQDVALAQAKVDAARAHLHSCQSAGRTLRGGAYSTFDNSPASAGSFQFDLWDNTGAPVDESVGGAWARRPWAPSELWDWEALRADMRTFGLRNSLSVALMPTVSTSTLLGNCESFSPYNAMAFARSTLSGDYTVWNRHLVRKLEGLGLWTQGVRDHILRTGSIRDCPGIPPAIKRVYRTAWELGNKVIIDLSADRARYVCQSQSMNLYAAAPTEHDADATALALGKLSRALQHAWQCGLVTGKYYLHVKPVANGQVVQIARTTAAEPDLPAVAAPIVCTLGGSDCISCSA